MTTGSLGQGSNCLFPSGRRGRVDELGEAEASLFEHVGAETNFSARIARVCKPPNSFGCGSSKEKTKPKPLDCSATLSPLCRRGRMDELGEVEASVFEHVDAQRIVRVCEPPNSVSRPRLAPRGRQSVVAFSLVTFLLAKQEMPPGNPRPMNV
jgi:hypothetical protein